MFRWQVAAQVSKKFPWEMHSRAKALLHEIQKDIDKHFLPRIHVLFTAL